MKNYRYPIQQNRRVRTNISTIILAGPTKLHCLVMLFVSLRALRILVRRKMGHRRSTLILLVFVTCHANCLFYFFFVYSRPIRLENFAEHYRAMSADSDIRFSEEFEELKAVGKEQACTAADLPCNRPKNRFTNILPYDHSRVKLQPVDDEEGSDYINANYVPVRDQFCPSRWDDSTR